MTRRVEVRQRQYFFAGALQAARDRSDMRVMMSGARHSPRVPTTTLTARRRLALGVAGWTHGAGGCAESRAAAPLARWRMAAGELLWIGRRWGAVIFFAAHRVASTS